MSTEENKAVVRRIVEEVWNQTKPAAAEDVVAAACVHNGMPFGPQAVRAAIARATTLFPDSHWTIDDLLADHDKVALRWHSTGTHRGASEHPVFGHVAPTGKQVEQTGINLFRI